MFILYAIILSFSFISFLIVAYNYFTAPRITRNESKISKSESISVLIPARNEENNTKKILDSLISQTYKQLNIIVLDDHSTDKTKVIVKEYTRKHNNISLIIGETLPKGWLGKNWACHQLSKHAKGDYYLFVDADVELKENAIDLLITKMEDYKLDAISVFPSQRINGFGQWLVVPMMNWLLLSFLPLNQVFKSKKKSFTAANGQLFLFKKYIYKAIGGHEKVKNEVVEDMEFARLLKVNRYKLMTAVGDTEIFCSMYDSFNSAVTGFSKNFYEGFKIPKVTFMFLMFFFEIVFFLPFTLVFFDIGFLIPILLILLSRIYISIISRQNIFINLLLHPIQMIILFYVGIKSVNKIGIEWKGRRLV
ncbi:MAG: glycosyltransferase family 2 protein [Melioribacteraceae bacterium]|nr:glycosyltransferase family 2 protein [Melioribacteraceae bacterium]